MVLGYQSNSGIHRYSDKGGRPVYTGNHGWSRDTRLTLHSPSSMDDMGLYMATLDYPPLYIIPSMLGSCSLWMVLTECPPTSGHGMFSPVVVYI